ncbi:MAG: hypothetical protein Q9196_002573 [Gyalolechia fulgens]
MKSFIISAVIGLTVIGIQGVNAAALPKVDIGVKRSPQEHCWEAEDGQIHCSLTKRDPQEHCWEAEDGQIHCSLTKRDPQEHCWEAEDGQIHCSLDKRDAHAEPKKGKHHRVDTNYPSCGAAICRKTFKKRDGAEQCWEAADGQIHCSLKKRQEHCWEAPDGQVHCSFAMEVKRDASPESPQNITFVQFRQLNPDVSSTCTNLQIGYAYCIQGIQALRVTEARNGTRGHGLPDSFSPAVCVDDKSPFIWMHSVTYNDGFGASIVGLDLSLHTYQTQLVPNGTVYHLPQPGTTAAVGSAATPMETSGLTQVADNGRLSTFGPTVTG